MEGAVRCVREVITNVREASATGAGYHAHAQLTVYALYLRAECDAKGYVQWIKSLAFLRYLELSREN